MKRFYFIFLTCVFSVQATGEDVALVELGANNQNFKRYGATLEELARTAGSDNSAQSSTRQRTDWQREDRNNRIIGCLAATACLAVLVGISHGMKVLCEKYDCHLGGDDTFND